MRRALATALICSGSLLLSQIAAYRQEFTSATENLRRVVAELNGREVYLVGVNEYPYGSRPPRPSNDPQSILDRREWHMRVFAPGNYGYTIIGPGKLPIVSFVITSRTPNQFVDNLAAHELGHALVQSRGFRTTIRTGDAEVDELVGFATNSVQDVAIAEELIRQGHHDQPFLKFLLVELIKGLKGGRELAALDKLPSGLGRKRLATFVSRLTISVRGSDQEKVELLRLIPSDSRGMALSIQRVLSQRCCRDPKQYEAAVIAVGRVLGLKPTQIVFADD